MKLAYFELRATAMKLTLLALTATDVLLGLAGLGFLRHVD